MSIFPYVSGDCFLSIDCVPVVFPRYSLHSKGKLYTREGFQVSYTMNGTRNFVRVSRDS